MCSIFVEDASALIAFDKYVGVNPNFAAAVLLISVGLSDPTLHHFIDDMPDEFGPLSDLWGLKNPLGLSKPSKMPS